MERNVRHWELRRENQDAIVLQDTHSGYCDTAVRTLDGSGIIYPDGIPTDVMNAVVKMFKVNYDCLVGFFSETGYNIWRQIDGKLQGDDGPLYEAGNSPYDSTMTMNPDDPDCESLETLKRYCKQTGASMSEELGIPWGGCSREDSDYYEVE